MVIAGCSASYKAFGIAVILQCKQQGADTFNIGQISNSHSNAASYNTNHLDDNGDEKDGNGVKDTSKYRPYGQQLGIQ